MYTIGRAAAHAKLACTNAGSRWYDELSKIAVEDSLVEFFSRNWPFTHGEGVVTTTPIYNTGTLSTTTNNAQIIGAGTTWSASWPTPAILRIENGHGEEFLVTSFDSPTTLTIDTEWPYDNDTLLEYSLEFPAYDIPDYMDIDNVMTAYAFRRIVAENTYGELMAFRHGWLIAGYPGWYTIIPGNGTSSQKLWISPSPVDTYTIRYTYKTAIPQFFIWNNGTASVTNALDTVTGSTGANNGGTNWNTTGVGIVGKVFEIVDPAYSHPYNNGIVDSSPAPGATTLSLVNNWNGRTLTNAQYCISPQIVMPDDCIPLFRNLVESYVYARVAPERAAMSRQMYQSSLSDAFQRYERDGSSKHPRGVCDWSSDGRESTLGPGYPTELIVRTT